MKITCSSARLRAKFDTLAENYDKAVMDAKDLISQSKQDLIEKEKKVNDLAQCCNAVGHTCNTACSKDTEKARNDLNDAIQANSNLHAGYAIVFDNIDGRLNKRHMTKESQNFDYHWINHKVVMNRVSGHKLDESQRKIIEVQNIKLLPTVEDQKKQRQNYIVLVARMLVEHLDSFKAFKDVCVHHIPHKYAKEMAMRSETVSMR